MATVVSRREGGRKAARSKPEPLTVVVSQPSEEDIRLLAYRLFEMRSTAGIEGSADADWIEAERLLINDGDSEQAQS